VRIPEAAARHYTGIMHIVSYIHFQLHGILGQKDKNWDRRTKPASMGQTAIDERTYLGQFGTIVYFASGEMMDVLLGGRDISGGLTCESPRQVRRSGDPG
jgi:hypothetical protein